MGSSQLSKRNSLTLALLKLTLALNLYPRCRRPSLPRHVGLMIISRTIPPGIYGEYHSHTVYFSSARQLRRS